LFAQIKVTVRLKNIIIDVYKIFGKYKSGPSMVGSKNYQDLAKWNKDIFSKQLRALTADDLSRYTGKAMTTWGDLRDFKHFLPRILELTAELTTPYEIWIAFDKLEIADWENWEQNERKVVEEFMFALWENLINDKSDKAEWEFQDYFSSLAHYYPNFKKLLITWEKSRSKTSIKHLSNFIVNEHVELFYNQKIRGFRDKTENVNTLIEWLLTEELVNLLQEKYFEYENEVFAEKISLAERTLTNEMKNKST